MFYFTAFSLPFTVAFERLWKGIKELVIYKSYYLEFEALRLAIFGFFALLSTLPAASYVRAEF
jgi:hypothetical protein